MVNEYGLFDSAEWIGKGINSSVNVISSLIDESFKRIFVNDKGVCFQFWNNNYEVD